MRRGAQMATLAKRLIRMTPTIKAGVTASMIRTPPTAAACRYY
jgi:hypothetical protein